MTNLRLMVVAFDNEEDATAVAFTDSIQEANKVGKAFVEHIEDCYRYTIKLVKFNQIKPFTTNYSIDCNNKMDTMIIEQELRTFFKKNNLLNKIYSLYNTVIVEE